MIKITNINFQTHVCNRFKYSTIFYYIYSDVFIAGSTTLNYICNYIFSRLKYSITLYYMHSDDYSMFTYSITMYHIMMSVICSNCSVLLKILSCTHFYVFVPSQKLLYIFNKVLIPFVIELKCFTNNLNIIQAILCV